MPTQAAVFHQRDFLELLALKVDLTHNPIAEPVILNEFRHLFLKISDNVGEDVLERGFTGS
ncbi:MAG: hypothetical protein LBR11_08705 [Deltaproteobacteria bacterium]|nr:hypothetical protein [Deltaproteobacteria bacterium]